MHLPGSQIGNLFEPMTGRAWEAASIRDRIGARHQFYRSEGMARGDRVFILHGNNLEFFVDLLAIWLSGACAIPVDTRLTPFEIEHLLKAAQPRFAAAMPSLDGALFAALGKADVRALDSTTESVVPGTGDPGPGMFLDDPALILFTSGTTGNPKGVVHTHRSLRARWALLTQSLGTESYRRSLCLLPTHFGHGLICNSLFPWLNGADLGVLPSFNAEVAGSLGRIIDDNSITFLSSVPSLWKLALRVSGAPSGKNLKRVHCGSAPLSRQLWEDIRDWAGTKQVFNAYGITETGSWTAGTTMDGFEPADGLIGLPWGAEIRVLDSATVETGPNVPRECAVGEEGYIWLNTPALMQGYLDQDELTREVVENGWFSTGDAGLLDERGCLFLKGRLREEINKGGLKVYPGDIDAVAEAAPKVSDVCTFAVEDSLYGQNVGIALVIEGNPDNVMPDLRAQMSERLAQHQMPVCWYVVDEIPRTSRGKINRAAVAETCLALPRFRFAAN
jgi:acyl-CoA synthetase (AMP-forming)/AMP-acid ligase II